MNSLGLQNVAKAQLHLAMWGWGGGGGSMAHKVAINFVSYQGPAQIYTEAYLRMCIINEYLHGKCKVPVSMDKEEADERSEGCDLVWRYCFFHI